MFTLLFSRNTTIIKIGTGSAKRETFVITPVKEFNSEKIRNEAGMTHTVFANFMGKRNAIRMFNLSRIENALVTEDTFVLPENYDFSGRSKGRFGAFISAKSIEYKVRAQGIARQSIKERLWAEDQKFEESPDGKSIYMTFTSTQEEKILHWILSQGADIEPVLPEPFVEKWRKRILDMYKLAYKG